MRVLVGEIVQATRARQSSAALSQEMGYKTNVIYRWERRQASPTWIQFVKFCELADNRLLTRFSEFFGLPCTAGDSKSVLKHFAGVTPHSEIAKRLHIPKSTFSKWVRGRQEPPAQMVFDTVAMAGAHLQAFFGQFEKFRKIESVAKHLEAQNLFNQHPEALLLLNLLDLEDYKLEQRDLAWMARKCNLPLRETRELISEMVRLGIATNQDGKLQPNSGGVMLLSRGIHHRQCLGYWLDFAKRILNSKPDRMLTGRYRVFTADEEAVQEIKRASEAFIHHLGGIIENAQKRPQTKVLSLALCLNSALSE